MRMRIALAAILGTVLVVGGLVDCQCTPPPDPRPPIGTGKPVGEVDAGNPDLADSGPKVCDEDAQEENDLRDAAFDVGAAGNGGGGTVTGRSCGGDDDWYSVASHLGCDVDAHMTQGEGTGDIDLLLFDPDGQLVGSSSGPGSEEAIHVPATKDGAYAVRLRSGSRDDVPYTLSLTSTCTADLTCPADDANEENDSVAAPAHLPTGVPTQGVLCGLDEDWYLVPVTLGCIADAHVDFTHANGDIDFDLALVDGTRVATSNSTSNQERLTKVVTEGGMALRVFFFAASDTSQNTYRVVADEICAGQISCPSDDPFEPNDTKDTATRLFANKDESIGAICGDDDFYELFPQQGCTLHATLTFLTASGDLDLELQKGSDGTQLAISNGTTDTEQIDFAVPDNSRVVLRVFGFTGATNNYRLHVEQSCQ